jgi:hypothetical protein
MVFKGEGGLSKYEPWIIFQIDFQTKHDILPPTRLYTCGQTSYLTVFAACLPQLYVLLLFYYMADTVVLIIRSVTIIANIYKTNY